ncbi:hypothetical protein P9112_000482 [Eukaryota sp. TZLM1-RC]
MTHSTNVLIFGPGAIGLFYGAQLLRSNTCNVHFLIRSDFDQVQENGIQMVSDKLGDFHFTDVNLHTDSSTLPMIDYVLVCTKTHVNSDIVIKDLPSVVTPNYTTIVVVQNGLDNERLFDHHFPNNPIIGGISYVCASRLEPGVVRHFDRGNLCVGGHRCDQDHVAKLVSLFKSDIGIEVTKTANLRTTRFKKLIWNLVYNSLSVVLYADTVQLVATDRLLSLARDISLEVIRVAKAAGCSIDQAYADQVVEITQKMSKYKTSMLVDFDAKRPLELEWLHYSLINVAREVEVEVPLVKMLAAQLEFLDLRNRGHI